MTDVVIIGAGVTGTAVARELSKYSGNFVVLEQGEDVCGGTSKANSGLVHAGFDAAPGTLKAKMNVQGSRMMEEVCRELDVPYKRTGALVAAIDESERETLMKLKEQGEQNGVERLQIVEQDELREMEPHIGDNVVAALYAPTAALVCPFLLNIAQAENANVNGVEFRFHTKVLDIQKKNDIYVIKTDGEQIETKAIVNCAGVYADELHNMVSQKKYKITARRGEYCLLDHAAGNLVEHTIFRVPGPLGKGILVTPTVHGNILLGPNAEDILDKEGVNTTAAGIKKVLDGAGIAVQDIPGNQTITSFAGLRAHEECGDFILGEAADAEGFFDCVGIESPGLSSAPAIGRFLAEHVAKKYQFAKNMSFVPYRTGILHFAGLSDKEKNKLIKAKPAYGSIVCRCELITEGEILDAIYRPLGARSLDGVKRRVRAGMGRCQGGFCSPRVAELLAEARKCSPLEITKNESGSKILMGEDKEVAE